MGPLETGLVIIGGMICLILAGLPIGIALLMVSLISIIALEGLGIAISFAGVLPFGTVATYTYAVLPLYMLMGIVLSEARYAGDIFEMAGKWLGNLKGGLAMAGTVGGALFGAVCGSSSATAATLGTIAYPEMRRLGYGKSLSAGSLAAAGTLAILIPPSLTMIVYGTIVEESIGRLFIAGILPGILLTLMLCVNIWIWVKLKPASATSAPSVSWRQRFISLKGVWAILLLFLVVIGGIYAGMFTAMEAGAIGAGAAIVLVLAMGRVPAKRLPGLVTQTGILTARVIIIILGAVVFSHVIVISGFGRELSNFVAGAGVSTYLVLFFMVVVYAFLGMLMDMIGMLVITLPIFMPILELLGINYIWFGVFVTVLGEVCLITPPVGLNCYVMSGVIKEKDVHIEDVFKGILPLLPAYAIVLVLITIFPQIVMVLPQMMKGT